MLRRLLCKTFQNFKRKWRRQKQTSTIIINSDTGANAARITIKLTVVIAIVIGRAGKNFLKQRGSWRIEEITRNLKSKFLINLAKTWDLKCWTKKRKLRAKRRK